MMSIVTGIAKKTFAAAAALPIPAVLCLVLPVLVASHASPTEASEKTAAHASIQGADAGRHIAALADDSFEGREGGSRGGRAAGTYIVGVIEKLGLQPAGDAGTYYQRFGSMRNILALLPGSDPGVAHELIVVGAHYDHVGYGNANNSYGPTGFIHNGADDNASGVAGLLEVAEAFQNLPSPPRRSILFAFWDGEEKGLLGSYHFLRVRPAGVAGMTIVFSLNLDMIGRLRGERLEIFGARTAQGLRASLVQANMASNLELVFDWKIAEDSDHYAFIAARIPTLMLHTGLHDQYHRPSDDTHLINILGIEPVARLALDLVTAMADSPEPVGPFRMQSRSESAATRRQLEMRAAEQQEPVPSQSRWGVGTRSDPGEPRSPVVVRVTPSSPMARAGVAVGDRMMAIDGSAIESQVDMLARLAEAGDSISLDVDRKGRAARLEPRRNKPAAHPQEPQ
ncbi:MAG: M20/M25/M40 family metallo-hydrolase [Planctomycetota bacterium]